MNAMELWQHVLDWTLLSVPLSRWALAATMIFVTVVAQRYLVGHLHRITHRLAEHTRTHWDDIFFDAAEKPANGLILIAGMTAAVNILNIPKDVLPMLSSISDFARVLTIALMIWFIWRFLDGLLAYFNDASIHTDTVLDNQLIPVVFKTLKIFLVLTAVLVWLKIWVIRFQA